MKGECRLDWISGLTMSILSECMGFMGIYGYIYNTTCVYAYLELEKRIFKMLSLLSLYLPELGVLMHMYMLRPSRLLVSCLNTGPRSLVLEEEEKYNRSGKAGRTQAAPYNNPPIFILVTHVYTIETPKRAKILTSSSLSPQFFSLFFHT